MTMSSWRASFALLTVILVVSFLAGTLGQPAQAAQTPQETPFAAVERLQRATNGQLAVRYAQATSVARFVRATEDATIPLNSPAAALEDKAYAFFEEYGAAFGVVAPRNQLVIAAVTSDEYGSSVRLDQRFGALPVFNARLMVHFDPDGNITAVNGNFVPAIKVPAEPKLSATDATAQALGEVASLVNLDTGLLQSSPATLGVLQSGLAQDVAGPQALAYSITVTGPAVRKFVFIDALNGGVVEVFEGIADNLERQTYNAKNQRDYEQSEKCRFEGDGPSSTDLDCNNAHDFSGDTYNFFRNGFGRDSFDNKGSPLISYVHYFSTICPNAFWNGRFMTYCESFPHDDVAGHEITHGVTEFSANLIYAYQPGALNESFSDIFGEAIDLLNDGENEHEVAGRWIIGEGIAPGVGIRDMKNPENPPGRDPSSCSSPNYHCSASDNGGVHTNSGVPNKAFQLMVDGGVHNGVTVQPIGLSKAVAVEYRALTSYLTPYSNFVDANEALLASCRDLKSRPIYDPDPETGGARLKDRISKADCAQVKNALDAVQMTTTVCTNAMPSPAGALCSEGQTVAQLFADDFEVEKGWRSEVDTELYSEQLWQKASDFTSSGSSAWRANDELTSCSSGDYTSDLYLVSPEINLAGTSAPVLRFQHDFFTEGSYDGGTVEVNVNGQWMAVSGADFTLNGYNGNTSGAPNSKTDLLHKTAFTGYRHPANFPALTYSESRLKLGSYLAQDNDKVVQIRFRFGTDYCNGTDIGWYIDDVEIYECRLSEQ